MAGKKKKVSRNGRITSYPLPHIYEESDLYKVRVDELKIPIIKYHNQYDYAHFSMKSGLSVVEITAKDDITSYSISPKKLNIRGEMNGKKLTFTILKDEYLIIQINGAEKRVVIMADPEEVDIPASGGEGIFNVTEEPFQADDSGRTLSTEAIQAAIEMASLYGTGQGVRGVIYIPAGVYQIASLALKSNVDLYLEGGAVLWATMNLSQYTIRGRKDSIGKDTVHMIYTYNNLMDDPYAEGYDDPANFVESENMRIYGRGTIDGRGKTIDQMGLLTQTLIVENCHNFSTDGILYRDSGVWSVMAVWSENLEFTNFKVLNQVIHEDDCIDVNGSQNVMVKKSIGIALDDPYTTKTFEGGELFKAMNGEPQMAYNVTFDDCISWSICYGFKAGQGAFRDQDLITFKNGTVYNCAVGIGIHHKYGLATLKNIVFENIEIENISHTNDGHRTWIHFQAITGAEEGKLPVEDVTIRNIKVYDQGTSGGKIVGYDSDSMIRGLQFEDIYMDDLGRVGETLKDLDITTQYYYCEDVTINGVPVEDAPAPLQYVLEQLLEEAELGGEDTVANASEGYVYVGSKIGDSITFPIDVMESSTYKLEVRLKKHSSKGIFQTYVNGTETGDPYDQYYNGNLLDQIAEFGELTVTEAGIQSIKFEIVGKNPSSAGYQMVLKAIILTKI